MSGQKDLIDDLVAQPQTAWLPRLDQRQRDSSPVPAPAFAVQLRRHSLQNQLLDRTTSQGGPRLELAVNRIGNIYGRPHDDQPTIFMVNQAILMVNQKASLGPSVPSGVKSFVRVETG